MQQTPSDAFVEKPRRHLSKAATFFVVRPPLGFETLGSEIPSLGWVCYLAACYAVIMSFSPRLESQTVSTFNIACWDPQIAANKMKRVIYDREWG